MIFLSYDGWIRSLYWRGDAFTTTSSFMIATQLLQFRKTRFGTQQSRCKSHTAVLVSKLNKTRIV